MIGTLAKVAMDQVVGVGELIRKETVQLTADRIESSIRSVNSVDEAKLELELGGKNGYRVYSDDGENFLNYRYLNDGKTVNIRKFDDIQYSILMGEESERVDKICINNNRNNIRVTGGGC
jgi:hypothetical protein